MASSQVERGSDTKRAGEETAQKCTADISRCSFQCLFYALHTSVSASYSGKWELRVWCVDRALHCFYEIKSFQILGKRL